MPHRTDLSGRIRTIGLVASFVAVAAIGLTLVLDREMSGAVGLDSRPQRVFLLAVDGLLCVANLAFGSARRARARPNRRQLK